MSESCNSPTSAGWRKGNAECSLIFITVFVGPTTVRKFFYSDTLLSSNGSLHRICSNTYSIQRAPTLGRWATEPILGVQRKDISRRLNRAWENFCKLIQDYNYYNKLLFNKACVGNHQNSYSLLNQVQESTILLCLSSLRLSLKVPLIHPSYFQQWK
jgi:hypothetical protein